MFFRRSWKRLQFFFFWYDIPCRREYLVWEIVFPFPMINGNFAIIFPLWLFLRGLLFYFARVVFACVFIFPKERCSTAQHSCKQTFCKKRRYKIVSLSVFPLWSHYSAFEISSLPAGHQWQEKKTEESSWKQKKCL